MTEDRIERRVSSLLSLAAHPDTPEEERARAQAMADELMTKYNIEQALLNWEKPLDKKRKPVTRFFEEATLIANGAMSASQRDIAEYMIQGSVRGLRSNVFRFAGLRVHTGRDKLNDSLSYGDTVVGYEEDIFYAEMLWNSVFQQILVKMYPGWDTTKHMDFNVYRLKNAGYSWPQIREIGLANGAKDHSGPLTHQNAGSKLRAAYGREAKRRNEDPKPPRIQDPHWWRRSFITSFCSRIEQRTAALKAGREEYFTEKNLPAIQKSQDDLDEAFYDLFPYMRPPTPEEQEKLDKEMEERMAKRRPVRAKKQRVRYADDSAWQSGYEAASDVKLTHDKSFDRKEQLG